MKRTIIYIMFGVFFSNIAFTQTTLTLDSCRIMAIEHNVEKQNSKYNIEKAKHTARAYKANFFPKISISGTYLYSDADFNRVINGGYLPTFVPNPLTGELVPNIAAINPDGSYIFNQYAYMPDIPFSFDVNGVFNARLTLEQPIFMGGKITAAYKMAKIGKDVASMTESLSQASVIQKCDEAYWTCVKATQMGTIANKYKEAVEEVYRNVFNAVEIGMAHNKDLLTVQVKLNEAELNVRKAENGLRLAKMNLCYTIGLPFNSDISIQDSSTDTVETFSFDQNVSARPEYNMLSKQVELKRQQVNLTKSEFLPNLGIMATYGYTNGLELNDKKVFDNSGYAVVASLKIPIFHWGEGYNKVKAAELDMNIAEKNFDDLSQKMQLEANQAFNAYDEAILEVSLTRKAVEQAEENLKVSKDRFDEGMETLANHLEAQTALQKAQADLINAQAAMKLNRTKYLKAIGKL